MSDMTRLLALACCAASLTLAGCAGKHTVATPVAQAQTMVCTPVAQLPEGLTQSQAAPAAAAPQVEPARAQSAVAPPALPAGDKFSALQSIYFDFDSYLLDADARNALEQVYQQVGTNSRSFRLEGFCDERGDDEYNLALGERRATGVKSFLAARGIDEIRLSVVSYGREHPVDPSHTDQAWKLNRRVEVVDSAAPAPDSHKRYGRRD
jgi:peptidoglycan-associated lipoprotein